MFDMLQIVKHQMLLFVPHMVTIIHDTLGTHLDSIGTYTHQMSRLWDKKHDFDK